jgi:colanic acid biosynthesis glycosyl transferase WcaI
MAKSIVILSELYYPDDRATGYLLTRLAEALGRGCQVRVLCGRPSNAAHWQRAPAHEIHQRVVIQRCASTHFSPERLVLRLINFSTLSSALFFAAWKNIRTGDVVLAVTNPPILPLLAAVVCRLRGVPGILLIHDLYPDVLVAAGLLRPNSFPVRALNRLNRWTYRQYARIVVLGRDMQARVAQALDAGDTRVVCIPNWADADFIQPRARAANTLLAQLGLSGKFVIQYSGNMGRTHGLGDLLNAAKQLSHLDEVHFLLIGSGSRRDWLAQSIADAQAANITLLPARPRAELEASLNGCDIAVISMVQGMAGISVPSRLYNIMAVGKPIIAVTDPESELARVVQEERIGWVVAPGRPEQLAKTIVEARGNPNCLAEMGLRARAAAEGKYSFTRITQAYGALFDGLPQAA